MAAKQCMCNFSPYQPLQHLFQVVFLQSQVNLRTRRAGSFRTKGGGAVVDHSPAVFTGFSKKYFLMPSNVCTTYISLPLLRVGMLVADIYYVYFHSAFFSKR